jgi:hypothetical protein
MYSSHLGRALAVASFIAAKPVLFLHRFGSSSMLAFPP